jgi:flagellar biosynthesis protein FlhG
MRNTSARTIAVASGKGGVGKTWFAITLAHALARRGDRVLLFDGDLGLANVDVQLGLMPQTDLGRVIAGQACLEDAIVPFEQGRFALVPGRSGSGDLSSLGAEQLESLLLQLDALRPDYDQIILDLGAGVGRAVRRMAAWADTLLVLALQEPTSLTDAYATLKLHAADRPDGDARLVVNQASDYAAGERTAATLTRACSTFLGHAPAIAGTILRDPRVPEAIRRQTLFLTRHPTAPAAADIERIAAKL